MSDVPSPCHPESMPFPRATLVADLRASRLWVLPLAALLLVAGLGLRALIRTPLTVLVHLREGHGIKVGDAVKYRGIDVGRVSEVKLAPDLQEVRLRLELDPGYHGLAVQGSSFWVMFPKAGLAGVQGLDTLIGPRYVGVAPGQGPPQAEFVGLDEPPPAEAPPGSLEITLTAPTRGSLRPGAPVLYRQCQVGTVMAVGLSPDAVGVDLRLAIDPAFIDLVRDNTRFWNASGLALDIGLLRGLSLDMESLQTVLAGGICLATPDPPGAPVRQGHRFPLHPSPEAEWLTWKPVLWLGDRLLPPATDLPVPVRVQVRWSEPRLGGWWQEQRVRRAWSLPTAHGLLAPADLAAPTKNGSSPAWEAAGQVWQVASAGPWGGLPSPHFIVLTGPNPDHQWPADRRRRPTAPEDACAIGDPHLPPLPLQAGRFRPGPEGVWLIDPALGLPATWHGAVVLARRDGKAIGQLQILPNQPARVALFPEP
ncbi:MAG: Paraquat-inducible protein B [Candidatus Ozemobacter sibiricus]|uniref:Paraquat-inducible protein B n=1 Tax=Candidatus Ozemobacter sibiricus TaxID=2268124 RepID=A0A367ZS57_9BACT|nr:MAG: Paraquat-inducible protein B [Candidatus Ozemobacter sibiricus]